jgi:hypothetical protein
MRLGVGQWAFRSPREQDYRDCREDGQNYAGTGQQGPCAVTQGVEGGHGDILGRSGVEY